MGVWMEKVLPAIHKFLWRDDTKKAAEQACKSFDESKDAMNKEFEEKKGELKPKVIEIYEASATEIKTLIKEPNGSDLKKHSTKIQKFLDELVKIDFPGSRAASEATSKYGTDLGQCPIIFVLEKVSTLIVTEEVSTKEVETPPPPQTTSANAATVEPPSTTTMTREIIVEKAAAKEPERGKVATTEPPAVAATTTVTKEIIVEKAIVKEPEKGKVATTVPPAAATTTVAKEIIIEKVDITEPEKGKVATTETPVATAATTMAKEIVVKKADVKEPEKADAPAKNGKEPPKVEGKKEAQLKP